MSELTKDDVQQIFFAISVAQGEIGNEFEEIKAKLYRLYPEVKIEHEQNERAMQAEAKRQTAMRKKIVEDFLNYLNGLPNKIHKATVLEELIEWYLANESEVRNHYSDEICFPFDLWKYADEKLIARLAQECRTELAKGSDYDKNYVKRSDKEIVHGLIRILERETSKARAIKSRISY